MKSYKANRFLSGRGYYVLLILCVAAAGVFTYAAVRNSIKGSSPEAQPPYEYEYISPEQVLPAPLQTESSDGPEMIPAPAASDVQNTKSEESDAEAAPVSNPVQPAKSQYLMPVDGQVIKLFSDDELVFSQTMNDYRAHIGIDIAAATGSSVKACTDGTIEQAYVDEMMGATIVITQSDGKKSIYSNLQPEFAEGIAVGSTVSAGDVIGSVGASALAEISDEPHLHFAVLSGDEYVDPTKLIKN